MAAKCLQLLAWANVTCVKLAVTREACESAAAPRSRAPSAAQLIGFHIFFG